MIRNKCAAFCKSLSSQESSRSTISKCWTQHLKTMTLKICWPHWQHTKPTMITCDWLKRLKKSWNRWKNSPKPIKLSLQSSTLTTSQLSSTSFNMNSCRRLKPNCWTNWLMRRTTTLKPFGRSMKLCMITTICLSRWRSYSEHIRLWWPSHLHAPVSANLHKIWLRVRPGSVCSDARPAKCSAGAILSVHKAATRKVWSPKRRNHSYQAQAAS